MYSIMHAMYSIIHGYNHCSTLQYYYEYIPRVSADSEYRM